MSVPSGMHCCMGSLVDKWLAQGRARGVGCLSATPHIMVGCCLDAHHHCRARVNACMSKAMMLTDLNRRPVHIDIQNANYASIPAYSGQGQRVMSTCWLSTGVCVACDHISDSTSRCHLKVLQVRVLFMVNNGVQSIHNAHLQSGYLSSGLVNISKPKVSPDDPPIQDSARYGSAL